MRNTPTCSPILPSLNLVASCLYLHVKRRKVCCFDVMTLDSFVWNGIGEAHANRVWTWWFKKYQIYQFYRHRTAKDILSNHRMKTCQPMSRFSRHPRSTYCVLETATRGECKCRWTFVRRSSVTPDPIMVAGILVLQDIDYRPSHRQPLCWRDCNWNHWNHFTQYTYHITNIIQNMIDRVREVGKPSVTLSSTPSYLNRNDALSE